MMNLHHLLSLRVTILGSRGLFSMFRGYYNPNPIELQRQRRRLGAVAPEVSAGAALGPPWARSSATRTRATSTSLAPF